MYSPEQLDQIFSVLNGKHSFSADDIAKVRSRIERTQPAQHLHPFLGLIAVNEDLFAELAKDKQLEAFSYIALMPESIPLIYGSETSPTLRLAQGNRGYIAILRHPEKNIVIKPLQSPREARIAGIADMLGVGPKQLPTREGFITEEYIDAPLFTQRRESPKKLIYTTGRRFGEILNALHANDIYFNDNSLADDMGRSHLFVPSDRPALLFDYGVALDVSNVRQWSDQEVFDYIRTEPGVNFALQMNPDAAPQLVAEHAPIVRSMSKEKIFGRDEYFVYEGASCASYRISNIDAFMTGFTETYER